MATAMTKEAIMSDPHSSLPAGAIAIVGMAGRFPGSPDLASFWTNLREGRECRTEFSDAELRAAGVDDALLSDPGYVRAGFVLDDIARFDAEFFGMSPRQARLTDPQQRLFLECAWQALEQIGAARIDQDRAVGVFASATISNYLLTTGLSALIRTIGSPSSLETLLGNDKDYLATLTSYKLNLRGPSITVQTACSSSLVAIHLACQSLLSGECNTALAGGVTVRVPHRVGYLHRADTPYSPDGHCRAFDAEAKGSVFGSGVGVVALRRLQDALADGDLIRAVIRGSAINNDGARKMAFAAPSVDGQAAVIAEALGIAEVGSESIDYIETHGTGTALGDPIETEALKQAFGNSLPHASCALGSLKTNIGHLETAAGVAGLIKVVLALEHGELPPSLNFATANPHLGLASSPFFVNTALRPWPASTVRPRRAGVSSFGIGGSNAHLIVEEAPARSTPSARAEVRSEVLLLSARSATALTALASATFEQLDRAASSSMDLRPLAHTASVRREHHRHRLAVTGTSASELGVALRQLLATPSQPVAERMGKRVFVFSGQGGQWVGMGRGLLHLEAFDRAITACERAMAPFFARSLRRELQASAESSHLDDISVLQPLVFAVQVGLAALWRAWGIEPDAVVGHSLGEVAAAHVAGALTLDAAARVICTRARLLKTVAGRGAMAVVGLSLPDAEQLLHGLHDRLSAAVSNGPSSTVISGEPEALAGLVEQLRLRNVFCQALRSDAAGHSPQMDGIKEELRQALGGLTPQPSAIPFYSTVTASVLDGQSLGAAYWPRNLRELVRFHDATETLIQDGYDTFIELGSHALLQFAIEQNLARHRSGGLYVGSLRRDSDERASMLQALAALHVRGVAVDWRRVYPEGNAVAMPPYPFEGEHHWVEPGDLGPSARPGRRSEAYDPLLGLRIDSPLARAQFEIRFDGQEASYLDDHRFEEQKVTPGASYAAMLLSAAGQLESRPFGAANAPLSASLIEAVQFDASQRRLEIESFEIVEAMLLGEAPRRVQLTVGDGGRAQIFSRAESETDVWQLHATARLGALAAPVLASAVMDEPAIAQRCSSSVTGAEFYSALDGAGYRLGPSFRWLGDGRRGDGVAMAALRAPTAAEEALGALHPGVLDICFQILAMACGPEHLRTLARAEEVYLPVGMGRLRVWPDGKRVARVACELRSADGSRQISADVVLWDVDGVAVVEARDVQIRRVPRAALEALARPSALQARYQLEWRPAAPVATAVQMAGRWLLVCDREASAAQPAHASAAGILGGIVDGIVDELVRALVERGAEVDRVVSDDASAVLRQVGGPPWRGVIHLVGSGAASNVSLLERDRSDAPWPAQRATTSVLAVLQAAVAAAVPAWVVTTGAQQLGGSDVSVSQAAVWGLARAAEAEHPEMMRGLVDLDPDEPAKSSASRLAAELATASAARAGAVELAYRGGQRWVPRLIKPRLATRSNPLNLSPDARYLITGGLGGLGSAVARWLVERGARDLILVGRSAPSQIGAALIAELETHGASIELARIDVAALPEVEQLLARCAATGLPLRGIVHAAGELDDGILIEQTPARLQRAFAAKAHGAWNLHRASAGVALDFFALFSSTASVLGAAGQSNYAAASAFLDGLAQLRRQDGLPAVSLRWGPWADIGRAATQVADAWRSHGVAAIRPADGLAVLEAALAGEGIDPVIFPVRWDRYLATRALVPVRLAGLAPSPVAPTRSPLTLDHEFTTLPPKEARRRVAALVATEVRELLGLPVTTALDPARGLFSLGMDSLRAIELKNRLSSRLGRSFAASVLFEHATCEALTRYLATELLGLGEDEDCALATPVLAAARTAADELATLADSEINARLDQALQRLERGPQ
jgi:acyl transferase domain-containing protein/aryl carrier-like protein